MKITCAIFVFAFVFLYFQIQYNVAKGSAVRFTEKHVNITNTRTKRFIKAKTPGKASAKVARAKKVAKKGCNVVVSKTKKATNYVENKLKQFSKKITKGSKAEKSGATKELVKILDNVEKMDISVEINDIENNVNAEINNELHINNYRPEEDDADFNRQIIDDYINHNKDDGFNHFKENVEKTHPEDEEFLLFSKAEMQCDTHFCHDQGDGVYGFGICTPYMCSCKNDVATEFQCEGDLVYDPVYNNCDDAMTVKLCGMS